MEELKRILSRITGITTTLFKHISVALIYEAVMYFFLFIASNYTFTKPELIFWSNLALIVTYFSTSFAFSLFNRQQCFNFLSKDTNDVFPELLTFDFLFDIIGTAIYFFITCSVGYISFVTVIIAYVSNIVNFILARFMWLKDKQNKVSTRLYEVRLIAHLLLSVVGLSLFFFFMANLIPAVSTLIMIAKMLSYLIFLPIGFTIFLYLRAIHKMRFFLKDFKKFCKSHNIEQPSIIRPYLTVFKANPDTTFLLKTNGKTYSCSLLSFTNIFLPVIFKSDGFSYRLSKRALKDRTKPVLTFEKRYSHESEFPKIIVITSFPSTIMVQYGNKLKDFDTGDMSGDCKIFTPQGFFGAIERKTIDRKSYE